MMSAKYSHHKYLGVLNIILLGMYVYHDKRQCITFLSESICRKVWVCSLYTEVDAVYLRFGADYFSNAVVYIG